jgi:hypothetical protein
MLNKVTIYPLDAASKDDAIEFEDVEFLSFINHGTFGIPAIIGPGQNHVPDAEQVLYVNTGAVLAIEVEK